MPACLHCQRAVTQYTNYCSWDCHVLAARAAGAVEHLPNGLPVRCISREKLLECEHGDHPTYICPVKVVPLTNDPEDRPERHALIYSDGIIAVTLYEACYAAWYVRTGQLMGGSLWKPGEWCLSEEAVAEIRKRFPEYF